MTPPPYDPQRASPILILALIGVGLVTLFVGRALWGIYKVPNTQAALRVSLEAIRQPGLTVAVALHPDYCSVNGMAGFGWSVTCDGVPLHYYLDTTICLPTKPESCFPAPEGWTNCVSFWWDIDIFGRPSNPMGTGGPVASISDPCRYKGSIEIDRAEMTRRGLTPSRTRILDFTGRWPRPPDT